MPKRKSNLQLIPDQPQRGSGGNTTLKMRIDDLITIDAMTETQGQFFSEYSGSKAMILHGAAGTGKTFIALYKALEEV